MKKAVACFSKTLLSIFQLHWVTFHKPRCLCCRSVKGEKMDQQSCTTGLNTNVTLCLFAESWHMGCNIRRNHLDSFCLSIAMRNMAVNGSRLTQNVLRKASETSTALFTQSSSWLLVDKLPIGMLLSYSSLSWKFQALIHWRVTFAHFCTLQVSNTDPMACYFHIRLYPSGFRNWSCGMLLSYTSVPCRFQTLVHWRVIFVYCCILQISDTCPAV
jgi:hypothetical protein